MRHVHLQPGNLMHLAAGRLHDLVDQARTSAGYVVCHETLPAYGAPHAQPSICRGFHDRYDTQALQLIRRLWGFVEVDPPDAVTTDADR